MINEQVRQRNTSILWYHSYTGSKNNKRVNITKRNILTDTENKLFITSGERGRGQSNMGVGHEELQTIRYSISYRDILHNMGKYNQHY